MKTQDEDFSVSLETLRKISKTVDRKVVDAQRWGTKHADRVHSPRGAGVRTSRPLERVEVDHFLLDVHVLVPVGNKEVPQRPWLSVAIDHYSGAIIGYHLGLATPSASVVLALLRNAVLPKGDCA